MTPHFSLGDVVNYAGGRYYIASMRLNDDAHGSRVIHYGLGRTDFLLPRFFHDDDPLKLDGLRWYEIAGRGLDGFTRSARDVVVGRWEPISGNTRFKLEAEVVVDDPGSAFHGRCGEVVGIRVDPLPLTRHIYEVKGPYLPRIDMYEQHLKRRDGQVSQILSEAVKQASKAIIDKGVLGTWQGFTFHAPDIKSYGLSEDSVKVNQFDINDEVYITHPGHTSGGRGPYRVVAISAGTDAAGEEVIRYGLKMTADDRDAATITRWYDEDILAFRDEYEERAHKAPDLPRWQCHKVVHAAKVDATIGLASREPGSSRAASAYPATLVVVDGDDRLDDIQVSDEWLDKHWPHDGETGTARIRGDLGYYVVYEDGHTSWSPTKAFEGGYTRIEDDE